MKKKYRYYSNFGKIGIDEYFRKYVIDNPQEIDRLQSIISLIPKDGSSILDIGSGSGFFLYLAQKMLNFKKCYGIEPIESKIQFLKRQFNLEGIVADASYLPIKDASFDVVTALEVIEHLPLNSYETTIHEIQRIASKYIVISVPHNEQRVNVICPICKCEFNPNYHVRSFNEKTLMSIFPQYKNIVLKKIGRKEKSIIPFKIFYTPRPVFPEFAICPLCGYRKLDTPNLKQPDHINKNNLITKLVPKITTFSWIVGVYEKC